MNAAATKAQPNSAGVTWSPGKAGKAQIAVGADTEIAGRYEVEVWAIYTGTHDVVPATKRFRGDNRNADAREYANQLWARF